MSRPVVSNHLELAQLALEMGQSAGQHGHRAVLVLTFTTPPETHWLRAFSAFTDAPFIAARHTADRADRVTALLGREFPMVIHEIDETLDAGLMAALAGTVQAGGVLILVMPARRLAQPGTAVCQHGTDSDNAGTTTASPGPPRFFQRFVRILAGLQEATPDRVRMVRVIQTGDTHRQTGVHGNSLVKAVSAAHCTSAEQEQDELLERACRHLEERQPGCITITGRRGRGKSALLARIARWLDSHGMSYTVTASQPSALTTLFSHGIDRARYRAPSDACRSGNSVLLVDEASSLPLDRLASYRLHYPHVIYCTTVEGYENVGRAFEIRFERLLRLQCQRILALRPGRSWRWADGDPLERLMDDLLLATATVADGAHTDVQAIAARHDAVVRRLDRTALAIDEALLHRVYGLLRDTHYQTSAADLAHLLDAPGLQIWVLEERGILKAALLLALEGRLEPELHEAITSRQRRLPHQLLPQLLAQSANRSQALGERYARIIRIAVIETERRRRLGTTLLESVERSLNTASPPIAAIGASFASDRASKAFWQSNGYLHFHTGFRRNPRTGKTAIAVIKCFSDVVSEVAVSAAAINADNEQWRQGIPLVAMTSLDDKGLLRRFANGQRSLHDSYAALRRLQQRHPLPLAADDTVSRRQHEARLRKAVQDLLAT